MREETYPSDLSDSEWEILKPLVCKKRRGPKLPESVLRRQLNGIFYIVKTGCQWDMLPKCFGKSNSIFRKFSRWRDSGKWEMLNSALRSQVREKAGKSAEPSAAIIDSQSVKMAQKGALKDMMQAKK
jgi:putative transposase